MAKIGLNKILENNFLAVIRPIIVFLLDCFSQLHPEINMKEIEVAIAKKGTSAALVCRSVESVINGLIPEHQEELRSLARAFGERLLEEVDAMIWEPKIEGGELVGFRRKAKRYPR